MYSLLFSLADRISFLYSFFDLSLKKDDNKNDNESIPSSSILLLGIEGSKATL